MTHPDTIRPAHHPHGPSALGNPCMAGAKLGRLPFPPRPAKDADEGTLLHAAVAAGSMAGIDIEQEATAWKCIQERQDCMAVLGVSTCQNEAPLSLYDPATGELLTYGTADSVIVALSHGVVYDWKMGWAASPFEADQIACYVAMVLQGNEQLQTVTGRSFHPRAPRYNQSWEYTRADLPALIERIKQVIARRESLTEWEFVTGDHCNYCPAALICGARRRELATVESTAITVESLSPADIAELLPKLKRVDKIADAIKARAKVLANSGELPGWRLVDVRGREALTGASADHAIALQMAGFTDAQVWECAEIDLAKARAIAAEMPTPPGIKSKSADYHLAALAPFIGRAAGYQKLVETKETSK